MYTLFQPFWVGASLFAVLHGAVANLKWQKRYDELEVRPNPNPNPKDRGSEVVLTLTLTLTLISSGRSAMMSWRCESDLVGY